MSSSIRRGFPEKVVDEVIDWSTAPSTSAARPRPGLKISPKAFGRDRRLPITNKFRG